MQAYIRTMVPHVNTKTNTFANSLENIMSENNS